jgi:hypothetical protein
MSDLAKIDVEVLHEFDLLVTQPETGDRITYRKDGNAPFLIAMDSMRQDPDAARVQFLVSAWKAAHAKAQALGWLKS